MTYNHFTFCEQMARTLRAIHHTDQNKRFFKASGNDTTTAMEDQLSRITGPVLIAVDSGELATTSPGADALNEHRTYYIIVAQNTRDDNFETVLQAIEASISTLKTIRNVLFQRFDDVQKSCQMYPVGPIGDNYYGECLEVTVEDYPDYSVDNTQFYAE